MSAPQGVPQGSSFLRNAAATAAGVAGGALLFQGIQSLFGAETAGNLEQQAGFAETAPAGEEEHQLAADDGFDPGLDDELA